eukprot:15251973-Ditylum_brightwellii.AAC.1
MESTDGLVYGQKCVDSGGPIQISVGQETLDCIINMIGEPVDNKGPIFPNKEMEKFAPLHRSGSYSVFAGVGEHPHDLMFTKQRSNKQKLESKIHFHSLLSLP